MTQKTDNWSKNWNSSTNPSKQRKYRENAPLHVKDKLVSANLDPELREELGTRSISLRAGDRVKIMRGDESGKEGIVSNIDLDEEKVFINDIEVERVDGSTREKPFRPSNLQITALNIEDNRRLEKYDIDDVEAIGVEEEEMEEALEEEDESEMMQQMQEGESSLESEEIDTEDEETEEDEEPEPEAEEETGEAGEADYDEIVSGTISDAKEQLQELDSPDYEAALEAEKDNKNRTTFTDWLENKVE